MELEDGGQDLGTGRCGPCKGRGQDIAKRWFGAVVPARGPGGVGPVIVALVSEQS